MAKPEDGRIPMTNGPHQKFDLTVDEVALDAVIATDIDWMIEQEHPGGTTVEAEQMDLEIEE